MPSSWQFSALLAYVRRWRRTERDPDAGDEAPQSPVLDPAEEFQKIQRGLRRLSLASDRNNQAMESTLVRLDEIRQTLFAMSRPREAALALGEGELLRLLDDLDRAAAVPQLPPAARSSIESAMHAVLAGAGWCAVALIGARAEGADIRIAERVGDAAVDLAAARIHRILEQGYRRADGTLVRPAVVVVTTNETAATDTDVEIASS